MMAALSLSPETAIVAPGARAALLSVVELLEGQSGGMIVDCENLARLLELVVNAMPDNDEP